MTQPITIVLLGVTGAGKSTFASIASGKDVRIGHGVDPCTQDPLAVKFKLGDQEIVLIDTPGFDDDKRSDLEILRDIAGWLGQRGYVTQHRSLDGLILLHPATHAVVSKNERKRSRILESILGEDAYNRVVIAATMWEHLEHEEFNDLLHGRAGEKGPWVKFRNKGATITTHDNTAKSAHRIIQLIINNTARCKEGPKAATILSKELVTPLGEELRAQIEEDMDLTWKLLQDHKKKHPPKEWKKSKDVNERFRYEEWKRDSESNWKRETKELEKRLEIQQKKLNKMDSMI
ncbi:hypothetical protein OQA88_12745 [Cercophora sp. LCS_1]